MLEQIIRYFSRSRSVHAAAKESTSYDFMLPPSTGAQIRSPEAAMTIAAVYRCVDILSGTIAALDLEYQQRVGSVWQLEEDSEISSLFAGEANDRQNFFVLMQNAIIRMLLSGNAYLFPRWGRDGAMKSLCLLSDGSVSYEVERNIYHVDDYTWGVHGSFKPSQLIHLKNKSLDGGYTGVSTIQYASASMSLSANADRQTNEGIMSGNQRSGFLTGGDATKGLGALSDSTADEVAERINRQIRQGHRIIRVPGSMSFVESSMSNSDVELLEIRKYTVLDVCRFFGVHPYMVFADQSTNYKEAENSQINFLNQTLRPILRQIEQEFSIKLIPRSLRAKRRVCFDLKGLFATSLNSRSEYIKTSIESGTMTPNEGRILEGRQPLEGGDRLFITCNVAPADALAAKLESNYKPSATKSIDNV